MFAPDIVHLRQFYATPLGEVVRGLVAEAIRQLWPETKDDVLLGIGFAAPYFEPYLAQGSPVIIAMPAVQGAAYWPAAQGNLVFLSHESELPLTENSVNRVLLVHSAEHSESLSGMMHEIWRVLTPGGRVLAIVPNRLSLWARSSRSPFGYGRPFSMAQLRDLMSSHQFVPTRASSALFIPPLKLKFLWRIAPTIEMLGRLLCPPLGGVLMIEAEKQVYAAIRQPVHERQSYRIPVAAGKPVLGRKFFKR